MRAIKVPINAVSIDTSDDLSLIGNKILKINFSQNIKISLILIVFLFKPSHKY
jgi:hypothetical protein